jgi:AraC-like DNA-binding protein
MVKTARTESASEEWVQFHQRADVYGIEFIHANYVKHRFSRHVHDYFVLGIIENGPQTFDYRGAKHRTAPSGIIVLNPDEPHTGEPASPAGFGYKAMYPSANLLRSITEEITDKSNVLPFFPQPVLYDGELAGQLLDLHGLLVASTPDSLAGETAFLEVFDRLITRYADVRYSAIRVRRERTAVQRVRQYIEANYDKNLTLAELACLVAFSPYYLARTFAAEVGIPPHAYLESIRIRHAQRLLMRGLPIAQVALDTGFPHQSHFTTRFRRAVGITPGQYIKERKIAQDNTRHSA